MHEGKTRTGETMVPIHYFKKIRVLYHVWQMCRFWWFAVGSSNKGSRLLRIPFQISWI
jgi:hypothetical protein